MKKLNTFEIIQNSALSAFALHRFAYAFQSEAKNQGVFVNPQLHLFFPVLPLIYHQDTLETILKSNELYTALAKSPEIGTSLQDRMNKMSQQTFDALNLTFYKELLTFDRESKTIVCKRNPINKEFVPEVRNILLGANKLGRWSAKSPLEELQLMLNIQL